MPNNSINVSKAKEQLEFMETRNPKKYNAIIKIIEECKKAGIQNDFLCEIDNN